MSLDEVNEFSRWTFVITRLDKKPVNKTSNHRKENIISHGFPCISSWTRSSSINIDKNQWLLDSISLCTALTQWMQCSPHSNAFARSNFGFSPFRIRRNKCNKFDAILNFLVHFSFSFLLLKSLIWFFYLLHCVYASNADNWHSQHCHFKMTWPNSVVMLWIWANRQLQ